MVVFTNKRPKSCFIYSDIIIIWTDLQGIRVVFLWTLHNDGSLFCMDLELDCDRHGSFLFDKHEAVPKSHKSD